MLETSLFWSIMAVIVIFFILRYSFYVIRISGNSMLPTFKQEDRVLALRYFPRQLLRPGNIVLAMTQDSIGSVRLPFGIIKRISALPGDNKIITIPEKPFQPRYCSLEYYRETDSHAVWQIPENYCFLEGDNPSESADSRQFGPFPISQIKAVIVIRLPH